MGLPAARITDFHVCPMVDGVVPHVGGPVILGDFTVLIEGLPAARIGDLLICVGPPDVIMTGVANVLIGGMPAARLTDTTVHGGVIVMGAFTVLIGGDATSSGGNSNSEASSEDEMTSQTYGGLGAPSGEPEPVNASMTDDGIADTHEGWIDTSNSNMLKAEAFSTTDTPALGDQIGNFAGQVGSGLFDGAKYQFGEDLSAAVQTAKQAYSLATSAEARNEFGQQTNAFVGQVGQAVADPGTAWNQVQTGVSQSVHQLQAERDAAYKQGRGVAFDAKLAGRALAEVGTQFIPAAGGAKALRYLKLAQGARESGISLKAAISLDKIATKYNVAIDMRPTNKGALKLIEEGFTPKPETIKSKSITHLDRQIGAPPNAKIGEIAHFEPTPPNEALKATDPDLYNRLQNRFNLRVEEQKLYGDKINEMVKAGDIKFDADNRLINAATGKPFAGDNDVFRFFAADGSRLSPETQAQILKELKEGPVKAQHGAHMDWRPTDEKSLRMKFDIINEHSDPALGGQGKMLSRFGPNGYSRVYANDIGI